VTPRSTSTLNWTTWWGRCRIKAKDAAGKPIEMVGEGLIARIWQHETDHLHGRLIIDRMDATDRIANRKKIAELEEKFAKTHKKTTKTR
jgi:peptide deformylase